MGQSHAVAGMWPRPHPAWHACSQRQDNRVCSGRALWQSLRVRTMKSRRAWGKPAQGRLPVYMLLQEGTAAGGEGRVLGALGRLHTPSLKV